MVSLPQMLRRTVEPHPLARKILLGCGVVASTWWVAMDVVGSLRYPGYSYVDYTISELSAEGAPTRLFMTVASGISYAVLMTAFGVGVWAMADGRRARRVTGALVIAEVLWGFAGGLAFPMAIRGTEGTLRNDMHAIYGIGMPILFLLAMGFGSRLFGKRFRYFTYADHACSPRVWRVHQPPGWQDCPPTGRRRGWDSRSARTRTRPCSGWRCWLLACCALKVSHSRDDATRRQ